MNRTDLRSSLRDAIINPFIILLALVVIVSLSSLKNSFFSGDDDFLIVNNPWIHLSLKDIPMLFTKPLGYFSSGHIEESKALFYRPMLQVLYAFNSRLWGINPVGFHLTNIAFHLLSAWFIYKIGLLLFDNDKTVSLIAASLFAAHPVNNEVLHRVAMNENIYGFFVISSIYFFIKGKRTLSWLFFVLALFSKESAVMLPFVLCILSVQRSGLKKGLTTVAPFALGVAAYFLLRLMIINYSLLWGRQLPLPLLPKVLTMSAAFFDYVRLLIIPYPLYPFYPARLYPSLLQPKALAGILTIIAFSFLAFRLRKDRATFFLLTSTVIFLLPVILKVNTFPIYTDMTYIAERFLYVPAMIFSLFISAFLARRANVSARKYITAGLIATVVLFAVITASSGSIWENDATFNNRLLKDAPDSAIADIFRGDTYYRQGKLNESVAAYKSAFRPNTSFNKQLATYYDQYMTDKSVGETRLVSQSRSSDISGLWKYQPDFADIHFALGRVYMTQGDIDRAIRKFRVTLALQPYNSTARRYLAEAYMKEGKFDRARKEFNILLERK
jgi:hypothetical protein